mmetsp:Transcript_39507/g.65515  ORF Transcript_39507/g.65515 Transcript_39507/m.65515 type:complete len:236 (+) Transcript_39507:160-867(+)|eukprot:CAMPEP_0119311228 /NCGR_PEP_ID=MMETSP1333-20130426/21986_1 /TAXON_ID=418940 /ORGANISM="Scyphosphaera apsteinii, Strain RCC1455" /LENGTH=235 /DNA_ID=CAMNT_0007315557 /DNA_START=159 /DNA_END=866 /DNA_ORIENTATION=+
MVLNSIWRPVSLLLAFMVVFKVAAVAWASHYPATIGNGLSGWLLLHPPRQQQHDAELLRRRTLASLVELPAPRLAEHIPAIVASLNHADGHVRRLAIGMLQRVDGSSLAMHACALAERLRSPDVAVRTHVVKALERLVNENSSHPLTPCASDIMESLAHPEAAVRWATVDVLALFSSDVLAARTLEAINTLLQNGDVSIARVAVSIWAAKLKGRPEVLSALGELSIQDTPTSRTF